MQLDINDTIDQTNDRATDERSNDQTPAYPNFTLALHAIMEESTILAPTLISRRYIQVWELDLISEASFFFYVVTFYCVVCHKECE